MIIDALDVAAIIGASDYVRPIDVFARLTGTATPATHAFDYRGKFKLHRLLLEFWAKENEVKLKRWKRCPTKFTYRLFGRPAEFIRAWPDAIAGRRLLLSRMAWDQSEWGEDGGEQVPLEVYATAQVEMFCVGYNAVDSAVVVAIVGGELRHYEIEQDTKSVENYLRRVDEFIAEYVLPNKAPSVDGSTSYARFLEAKYSVNSGKTRKANEAELDLMAKVKLLEEQIEKDKEAKRKAENELRDRIGNDQGLKAEGLGNVLWVGGNERRLTDWKALGEESLRLAKKSKISESRAKDLLRIHTSVSVTDRRLRSYWTP